jgi:hypothetical protein
LTKSERWILSEWRVAYDRVRNFKEVLIYHREKTPFAELDLVFAKPSLRGSSANSSLIVIEVKSWNSEVLGDLWAEQILSRRQLFRLERACEYLRDHFKKSVHLEIAVASQSPGTPIKYFEPPHF